MKLIEGRLGDSTKPVPWFTILNERVFVGDAELRTAYTSKVLLRGFQASFAGRSSRNLGELEVRLEEHYSVDDPGYITVEASLKLRDESPTGWSLFGLRLKDAEEVMFTVDYSLMVI